MSELTVRITHVNQDTIALTAPYHPDLIPLMRKLNGCWNGSAWKLDVEDESTVRSICYDIYGTTGDDNPELVSVRVHVSEELRGERQGVFLAGRMVARAYGRDSGAKLGPKVVVIQGDSPSSEGSMKNWVTRVPADSVIEIRRLPKPAAEKLLAEKDDRFVASLVGQPSQDLEDLKVRRQQLLTELTDVERMLEGYEKE